MDRTLDSIRPSEVPDGSDMSYLYGRDPSILAYGQRPVPTTKQNLISLYEDEELDYPEDAESTGASDSCLQTLKVYLRLKPLPRKVKLKTEEMESYQITNSTTLLTKLPSHDHTFSSAKGQKDSEVIFRRFTFSQTFGPETTQLQIFEEIMQQKMIDFLAGQNCTVMTYGTSNSGKSYTLQGTPTSPGIIPRGLEFVFSNINPRPAPYYKPSHNSNVISLNAIERAQEIEAKNKLLTFTSIDKHQYINAYRQMQKMLQEELLVRPSQACDAHYSVWVSFAEIYNENIFDLLSNDCQKRRPALKLGTDRYGRSFIKGLKTICVNSGSEAYQVLMAGQYNLKVAATALNARSSRSHCIFTIKLLKYYNENSPNSVELSTFAFCDLAGSERLKKTLNVGDRLKEAQNINTSLLVLGRCLKSIYEGQSIRHRQEHVGPFRESKLTQLFQRALSGKEQIALIVNVNPMPNLYAETQNVLNFSAIAKKIIVEPKKTHAKIANSRFSLIVSQTAKSNTDWDQTELTCMTTEQTSTVVSESNVSEHNENYEDLIDENESLKKEICSLKAAMLNKDLQIRQELADMYTAMMKQLETDWKNRIRDVEEQQEDHLAWTVNRVETFYKDKINDLMSRKRRRTSDCFSDDDRPDVDELEMENSTLRSKIQTLKTTIKNLRADNETVLTEKNRISFEHAIANEELKSLKSLLATAQEDLLKDEESRTYVDELRDELNTKHERVKYLKEFLNEAKEEYIAITSHVSTLEERLKERDDSLVQAKERVADLEELLEQTNICLAEKTKQVESLEDKSNLESNMLLELKERHAIEEAKLMERIQFLTGKIATLERSIPNDKTVISSNVINNEIKQEKLSESSDEVSPPFPHTIMSDGIVIKTDDEEIFDFPSTSYENDRASEVFVQILEISSNSRSVSNTDEDQVLGNELTKYPSEIESLKATLNSTKDQMDHIKNRLEELKNSAEVHDPLRERENSQASETLEHGIEKTNSETQTSTIRMNDMSSQTRYLEDIEQNEKSVQTVGMEIEEMVKSQKQLEDLRVKFTELEGDFKLTQNNCDDSQMQITNLTKDLARVVAEKQTAEQTLSETEEIRKKLEIQISECRETHEPKILSFEKELAMSNERERTQSEHIRAHGEEITNMKNMFAARIKELEEQILEMTKRFDCCQAEKIELEQKLSKNLEEVQALEKRLQVADKRDQDKDAEIQQLQKSIKNSLAADMHEKKTQEEMKKNLKELLETREALARVNDLYDRLNKSSKQDIKLLEEQIGELEIKCEQLESSRQKALCEKADLERLRKEADDLKVVIVQKECEMAAFTANRDIMITKYETLLKQHQEELEIARREITRFQELFHKIPTPQRTTTWNNEEDDQQNTIQVVDLANSDSKKSRRRADLPPPSSEIKRTGRKKKLFTCNESCIDLEVSDAIPPTPSPSSSTRSLRSRRK